MTIDRLLSRLQGQTEVTPGVWLARCPVCSTTQNNELAIKVKRVDGNLTFRCVNGCTNQAVSGTLEGMPDNQQSLIGEKGGSVPSPEAVPRSTVPSPTESGFDAARPEPLPAPGELGEHKTSLVCMADVKAEAVEWLWYPYIPRDKQTLLEGDPGVGKSWLALAIATAVSLGRGLPGQEATEPANVLLASAEDGLGDTIRPRLDGMNADVSKIHAIKSTLNFSNDGLAILESHIQQKSPLLVIIDPLVAYIGASVDLYRPNETRAITAKLADIAEKHSCAILTIRHLTKGRTTRPIYRGLGSIDFTAASRSVLLCGSDPEDMQKRGLVQIKNNLAPMGAAIGYELRGNSFYWTGNSDLTAARILATEDSEGKSIFNEATEFLRERLAEGAVEAKQVITDAKSLGICEKTLRRAKANLKVISRKQGMQDGWFWELPEDGQGISSRAENQS